MGLRNSGVVYDVDSSDEEILTTNRNLKNTNNSCPNDSKLSEDFETGSEIPGSAVKKETPSNESYSADPIPEKALKEEKPFLGDLESSGTFWGDWENDKGSDGN